MKFGKEIFEQLQYGSNKQKVWSWGAHGFKTFTEEFFQEVPNRGGLIFKVRGRFHGGHVMVRLKGNDTYHVSFGMLKKGEFIPRKGFPVYDGCYCDNFVDLIDEVVEMVGPGDKPKKEAKPKVGKYLKKRLEQDQAMARIFDKPAPKLPETDEEYRKYFGDLYFAMYENPEALHCDGEASPAEVQAKLNQYRGEWRDLEVLWGKRVTDEEAGNWCMEALNKEIEQHRNNN